MTVLDLSFASGEDSLSVRRFTVHEALSTPFRVEVEALSPNPDVDLLSILGQPASLRVVHGTVHVQSLGERAWHGVVASIAHARTETAGLTGYEIAIVPAFAMLAHRRDHRIFQHASVPDIVKEILDKWGIAVTFDIERAAYPLLEFRVQHGESDLQFVSRLLEDAGIAYLFDDAAEGPAITLVDRPQGAPPRPGGAIPFVDNPNQSSEKEFVTRVDVAREIRPGARAARDYDFRNPGVPVVGAEKGGGVEVRLEQYGYSPGAFLIEGQKGGGTPVADQQSTARHSEAWAKEAVTRAFGADRTGDRSFGYATNLPDLQPGTVFSVDHPHPALSGRPLLATELSIEGSPDKEWTIEGRAVLAEVPYRPPRRTPKPRARGVQTATVVGPTGQEIHTDELGRVRVRFHWDRSNAREDRTSCWLRVSQTWAGTGFGWTAIPRVGQEVVVSFFEDDPDQPVILSGTYNALEPVPYPLPGAKTASLWQSRSTPGSDGFNEIFLDDVARRELFYLQAQQDLSQLVRRNETSTVSRHLSKLVKGDETQTTGKERIEITHENRAKLVHGDHGVRVEGNRKTVLRKALDVTVQGSAHTEVGGDSDVALHGADLVHIGGTESRSAGADSHEVTFERHAIDITGDIHLLSDDAGVIEGFRGITLKVPGAFVLIESGGIVIKGPLVMINSGGVPGAGAGSQPDAPDPPRVLDRFDPPMPYGEPNPDGDVARPVDTPIELPPPTTVALTWIEIVLKDADGNPVRGERYRIVTPDGKTREGYTDFEGKGREEGLVPGECQITFPELDKDDWTEAGSKKG